MLRRSSRSVRALTGASAAPNRTCLKQERTLGATPRVRRRERFLLPSFVTLRHTSPNLLPGIYYFGTVTVLLRSVTAPDSASNRPLTVEPVPREIDACAMIVPLNVEAVLSVAELPTCQERLQGLALFVSVTELL